MRMARARERKQADKPAGQRMHHRKHQLPHGLPALRPLPLKAPQPPATTLTPTRPATSMKKQLSSLLKPAIRLNPGIKKSMTNPQTVDRACTYTGSFNDPALQTGTIDPLLPITSLREQP